MIDIDRRQNASWLIENKMLHDWYW